MKCQSARILLTILIYRQLQAGRWRQNKDDVAGYLPGARNLQEWGTPSSPISCYLGFVIVLSRLCNHAKPPLQLCYRVPVTMPPLLSAGTLVIGADIWHGRLSADKANTTSRNLLVYNKIWRYWQICHFLWRTKKDIEYRDIMMFLCSYVIQSNGCVNRRLSVKNRLLYTPPTASVYRSKEHGYHKCTRIGHSRIQTLYIFDFMCLRH